MEQLVYGLQFSGMALVLLLIFLCLRRRSLGLYSTRVYFTMLVSGLVCLIFDYATVWGISNYLSLSPTEANFIFKMYLALLVWVCFCGFYYAIHTMVAGNEFLLRLKKMSRVYIAAALALVLLLPLGIGENEAGRYFMGASVIATYISALFFVSSTLFFAIFLRKYLSRRSLFAIGLWLAIWIIAIIIQAFNMQTPLTSFAMALGFTVIFAELENPEGFIDKETGVFNAHALMDYMNQFYMRGEVFAGVEIIINLRERDFDREQKRLFLSVLGDRFNKIESAQVFRNVGDEFIIIFPNADALDGAMPRVRAAMESPITSLPRDVTYRPFYIMMPDSRVAESAEEIFRFHSYFKTDGSERDYIVVDEAAVAGVRRDLGLRQVIASAIEDNRVEIYYQPIYSIEKGRFISAEALARIIDENGEIIMPSVFIPVAEETGLILQLGRLVFEKVCELIRDKDIVGLGLSYIEINLSVAQCEQKTLAADFQRIMGDYGVDPRRINLEITESGTLSARKVLVDNMNTLIKSGVHFSLDDFGTGQSNLDYVMNMPVQIIKFDRTLTQAYFENDRTQFVFRAVTRMVKDMGLEIVCEGVETREQYEEITELGVDHIQGFYFSRPLPEKEFLYFIKVHNE